jgi:hypothetical protein
MTPIPETWTEEQIRKNANAGIKLVHNIVALLENLATDAAELASEYADTGDVSHDRLELLTRPLADVERSSLLAHAEAGQTPTGYETRWLPPSCIERLVDGLDTVADQYVGINDAASLGAAHVAGEVTGQAYLWFAAHEDEEDATTPVTLFQGDWQLLDTTVEDFDEDDMGVTAP